MFKQLVTTVAIISLFAVFTVAQEQTETTTKEKKECTKGCCSGHSSKDNMTMAQMDMDSTHSSHHQMKSSDTEEVTIVREGEIDLVVIDANGDGMVFQDQMCWNVISDEPGECPQCGMVLKEVSLDKAKENLQKNDYQVK